MKAERKHVVVPSKTIKFPSLCPKCLGKTDLTSYKSKWENTYLKDPLTKVTEKVQIKIPICRSCKRALLKETRIFFLKILAVVAPICWGILSLLLLFNVRLEALGDWGVVLLIGLALIPPYFLYLIIRPHGQVEWPVKIGYGGAFSFENETYAKLFEAANHASTLNLSSLR